MKLVAVWIEQYAHINNLGFNLGDDKYFTFKFNEVSRDLIIDVEKTSEYFDLFKSTKIKNISGLIGNNGAGKTTILKFINVCESKAPIVGCAVLIFKVDHAKSKYLCINYGDTFKSNKINIDYGKGIANLLGKNNFEVKESNDPFKEMSVIFYSNLYSDHNDNYLKMGNDLNRSVDYLTRNSLNREAVRNYIKKYDKMPDSNIAKEASFNILKLYFENRFRRMIGFISEVKSDHPKLEAIINTIPFPEWITMNYDENLFERVSSLIKSSNYDFKHLNEIIPHSLKLLEKIEDVNLKFRNELILKLFCFAFHDDLFKMTNPTTPLSELETFVKELKLDDNIFDEILNYMLDKKNQSMFYQISKMNKIFKKLRNNEYKTNIRLDWILSLYSYQFEVSDELWAFIKDINDLLEIEPDPLISFRWHSLSSGQEAILNQFLELWEGIKQVHKKNLLISIDEGELHLHPEWQRQYIELIYNFIEYTSGLNEDIENVQILLTDHSPFIVSDIPKHSLIFLKRDAATKENPRPKVIVANSQIQEPTFGGNIFDLFKHSFFVDHFIGAFSTRWIEEAFKRTNGEVSTFDNDKETQDFVKLIGEKVLREVLETNLYVKEDDEFEIIDLNEVAKKKLGLEKEQKSSVKKSSNKTKKKR